MIQIKTLNKHGRSSENKHKFINMVSQEVSLSLLFLHKNLERSSYKVPGGQGATAVCLTSEAVWLRLLYLS